MSAMHPREFNIVRICKTHDLDALKAMLQSPLFDISSRTSSVKEMDRADQARTKMSKVLKECVAHGFYDGATEAMKKVWSSPKWQWVALSMEEQVLERIDPIAHPKWHEWLFKTAYDVGGAERVGKILEQSFVIKTQRILPILNNPTLIEHGICRLTAPMVCALNVKNPSQSKDAEGYQKAWSILEATLTPEEALYIWSVALATPIAVGGSPDPNAFHPLCREMIDRCASKSPAWWDEVLLLHDEKCLTHPEYKNKMLSFGEWMSCLEKRALTQAQSSVLARPCSSQVRKL